jgi:PST family polysaccharide transporter
MRARVPAPSHRPTRREVIAAARALLGFGAPYAASMVAGAGVLMIVPVMVLAQIGGAEVGFYRAAAAISINYMGVLIAAMAQDYYPRVSAVHDQPEALARLINDQLRLVLLLGGPAILATLALVPFLLPLVYSSQFAPAGELLEWQLIGDLFKFSGWTMSFVILARMSGKAFFLTELFGGALLLLGSWLGMRWFGLAGLGMAFMIAAIASCALAWLVLRRNMGMRWSGQNKLLFLTFALAMIVVRVLPQIGLIALRTPVALALAMLLGGLSLYLIWGEVGGWKGLLAWRMRESERRRSQPG